MADLDIAPELEDVLARNPAIEEKLDSRALQLLSQADVDRAIEIVLDMAGKRDIRNPSAFVATALTRFPEKRGRPSETSRPRRRTPENPRRRRRTSELDQLLDENPGLARGLDD